MTWTQLDKKIWMIALPAFAALISEPLMLAADTAIVGRLGREQLAALGASSTIIGTIIGLCIFLAYGSTAAVARHQGTGDRSAAMSSAVGGVWLAAGIGFSLAFATQLSASVLAEIFASSAVVQEHLAHYLKVAAWSIPAALLVMASTGALRGVLDLRTPLIVMIAANILNVAATLVLVFVLNLGLTGAAVGLVFAQWCAAVWLLLVLRSRVHAAGASIRPKVPEIIESARTGATLVIRSVSLRAVLVIATWLAATMGDAELAAQQVLMTLVMLTAFALDSVAIAGQTMVGYALGAGDRHDARIITQRVIGWGAILGAIFGIMLAVGATVIPGLFTPDPVVQSTAFSAVLVLALFMPIAGIVYALDGILIGAGDGRFLAKAGVLVLATYLPLALAIAHTDAGFTMLWLSYGAVLVARCSTLWWRQRSDSWLITGSTVT